MVQNIVTKETLKHVMQNAGGGKWNGRILQAVGGIQCHDSLIGDKSGYLNITIPVPDDVTISTYDELVQYLIQIGVSYSNKTYIPANGLLNSAVSTTIGNLYFIKYVSVTVSIGKLYVYLKGIGNISATTFGLGVDSQTLEIKTMNIFNLEES